MTDTSNAGAATSGGAPGEGQEEGAAQGGTTPAVEPQPVYLAPPPTASSNTPGVFEESADTPEEEAVLKALKDAEDEAKPETPGAHVSNTGPRSAEAQKSNPLGLASARVDSGSAYIGTDPIYQNRANATDKPLLSQDKDGDERKLEDAALESARSVAAQSAASSPIHGHRPAHDAGYEPGEVLTSGTSKPESDAGSGNNE